MHEDLLRHIWAKQLIDTSRLVTSDGRSVRIITPGTLHRGSGPDFRNATVEIGGTVFNGDIEFHRTIDDWMLHHHNSDPNYNSVILHVVLTGSARHTPASSGRIIPTVILEPFLISPIDSIRDHLLREEHSSRHNSIKCANVNDGISPELLNDLINTMYVERVREKTVRLHDRLCDIIIRLQRTVGEPHPPYNEPIDPNDIPLPDSRIDKELFRQRLPWEQLLYEQIMDAMGFSNNREPMRRLAEHVPLNALIGITDESQHCSLSAHTIEAILMQSARLLPSIADIHNQDSKVHIHSLAVALRELPKLFSASSIHESEWTFSPTRPSNFPTIRIAAAAHLIHAILHRSLFRSLIVLIDGKYSSAHSKIEQLRLLLDPGDHIFWNYHYSFTEATHMKHALLGESRKNDIIVNGVVPFVSLYAAVFGRCALSERCLSVAMSMPLLEENSILRTMHKQLMKKKAVIEHAYQQQGLIQLHNKYCRADRCGECAVGKDVFSIVPRI
jgi:hypothetical protein